MSRYSTDTCEASMKYRYDNDDTLLQSLWHLAEPGPEDRNRDAQANNTGNNASITATTDNTGKNDTIIDNTTTATTATTTDNTSSDQKPKSDFDSPWKEALEEYFEDAIKLFAPDLHARIDWAKPVTFLDKEFQSISWRLPSGRKVVDKLAHVHGKDGTTLRILIHIEIQGGTPRPALLYLVAERVSHYAFRIRDGLRRQGRKGKAALFNLVVLTNSRNGPPKLQYTWEYMQCKGNFEFPVIHLGQWWDRWNELKNLAKTNPFAVIIMAQLLAHKYKGADRMPSYLALARMLHAYGYSQNKIKSLLRLVEWMLCPPEDMIPAYTEGLRAIEKEFTMSYVWSVERYAEQRGMAKGEAKAKLETLQAVLQSLLSLKFGPVPDWAKERLQTADADTLKRWTEKILFAESIEAVFAENE